jgi:hypothetical protein
MSSCSLSYLGGVFDRAAMILCGSDAVTDPVTGRIITPLPKIRHSLTSGTGGGGGGTNARPLTKGGQLSTNGHLCFLVTLEVFCLSYVLSVL